MTDQTESEYAVLLRNLDFAAAEFDSAIYEESAAAIRALEAKVRIEARRGDMWQNAEFALRADRDRMAGEVERLKVDVLRQMAWKTEAQDELEDICNELPGVAFMDPPDGGSVSIAEQVRRMYAALQARDAEVRALREDAARYRWLRKTGFNVPDLPYKRQSFAKNVAEIEAAINRCRREDGEDDNA